jgi:hypothetical protein
MKRQSDQVANPSETPLQTTENDVPFAPTVLPILEKPETIEAPAVEPESTGVTAGLFGGGTNFGKPTPEVANESNVPSKRQGD